MDPAKQKLVIDLALRRMSTDEFVSQFGVDLRRDHEFVHHALRQALDQKSGDDVECAMILAHKFGLSASWAPTLSALLRQDWHHSHENIASALQDIHDPSTVEDLYQTALTSHPYLAYDHAHALAVKCIWALHDIGTASAREKLALLADSSVMVIRENARKRLSHLSDAKTGDQAYRRARDANVRKD
jgi:hypothetical protein